jgi:hypothetical protein
MCVGMTNAQKQKRWRDKRNELAKMAEERVTVERGVRAFCGLFYHTEGPTLVGAEVNFRS